MSSILSRTSDIVKHNGHVDAAKAIEEHLLDSYPVKQSVMKALPNPKGHTLCRIYRAKAPASNVCRISQSRIAREIGFGRSTVSRSVSWLAEQGYFTCDSDMTPQEAKEKLQKKPAFVFWYKGEQCEWCQNLFPRLQEHHYPISKVKGGMGVVTICPGCHDEFHCLTDLGIFLLTQKALDLFKVSICIPSKRQSK